MSKTLNRAEMAYGFLSGFGIRHSFVIGYFVIHSEDVTFKVTLSYESLFEIIDTTPGR